MALDKDLLRLRIRREAGDPSEDELPDDAIDDVIDQAIIELSRWVSAWKIYSFKTAVEEQEYDVDPEVQNVVLCSWGTFSDSSELGQVFGTDFNYVTDPMTGDIEIGVYDAAKKAILTRNREATYDWKFVEHSRKLILIPTPTESDVDVYYVGEIPWTLSTCPSKYEKFIVKWSLASVLRILARKRMRMSAPSVAGGLMPWGLSGQMLAEAEKLFQEFEDEMRQESLKGSF